MLAEHDHFDDQNVEGWENIREVSSCFEGDYFLGGHCILSNQTIHKEYAVDHRQSYIKIEMNLHVFDEWSGEYIAVKIDDKVVFNRTFSSHEFHYNICGDHHPDVVFNLPVSYSG